MEMRRVSEDWKKANVTSIFKKKKKKELGKKQVVQPHLNPKEDNEAYLPGNHFQHMKHKKVT